MFFFIVDRSCRDNILPLLEEGDELCSDNMPSYDNFDLTAKISLCSLELEKILLERNLVNGLNKPPITVMIWDHTDASEIKRIREQTKDFRSDEVTVSIARNATPISFMAGNSLAMIKWASTLNTSKLSKHVSPLFGRANPLSKMRNWTTISSDVTNSTFIWWAERNGLKVYSLPPEGDNKWKTKSWVVRTVLIPTDSHYSPASRPKRDSQ